MPPIDRCGKNTRNARRQPEKKNNLSKPCRKPWIRLWANYSKDGNKHSGKPLPHLGVACRFFSLCAAGRESIHPPPHTPPLFVFWNQKWISWELGSDIPLLRRSIIFYPEIGWLCSRKGLASFADKKGAVFALDLRLLVLPGIVHGNTCFIGHPPILPPRTQ